MNKYFALLLFTLCLCPADSVWAQSSKRYQKNLDKLKAEMEERNSKDSMEVEDNPFAKEAVKRKTHDTVSVKKVDPIVYVMDRRHLHQGDDTPWRYPAGLCLSRGSLRLQTERHVLLPLVG